MVTVSRKRFFLMFCMAGVFTLFTTLVSCKPPNTPEKPAAASNGIKTKVLRMGYQSAGDILKNRAVLEKRLAPLGIKVEWSKFAAGPQLLEAMNVGSLDIGAVGDTPPIFAQATGIPFVYLASTRPGTGEGSAVVVHKDSPIKTVTQLKGKTVAFQRATATQYFVMKILQESGLKLSDIKHVNLTPVECRAAFLRKSIDATVVSDPHLALFQRTVGLRILRDGVGLKSQGGYYLAGRSFVKENPGLTKIVLEEINNNGKWAGAHPREVAEILAREAQIDIPTLETISRRRRYTLRPVSDEVLTGQQEIADLFHEQKFITKKINVREAALSPQEYAALTPSDVKP